MPILFIIPFIAGIIALALGFFLKKNPPAQRNHMIGYRSTASRKSPESWNMAQAMCGNILLKQGIILLGFAFLSAIAMRFIPLGDFLQLLLALLLLFGLLIYLFAKIEIRLSQYFD